MKVKFILPALVCLASACTKIQYIEFNGKTPGLNDGVFVVKGLSGKTIYGNDVKANAFHVKQILEAPGYYQLNITDNSSKDDRRPFEVYLEFGKYAIETESGHLEKYPKNTSESNIQNQLSAYYALADQIGTQFRQQIDTLIRQLDNKKSLTLSKDAYVALVNKLSALQLKETDVDKQTFEAFISPRYRKALPCGY